MDEHFRRAARLWPMLVTLLIIARAERGSASDRGVAESPRAMVASVHPLATQAGIAALREGGNAVDAAIATALTLGVVDGHNSGLGGGALLLIRTPDGRFHALDGRETAPARAHRDMYVRDGRLDAEASQTGPSSLRRPFRRRSSPGRTPDP